MRDPIAKQVRKLFRPEFERQHPQFTRWDVVSTTCDGWSYRVAPSLVFHTLLQLMEDRDIFEVEIAWSENDEFPWGAFNASVDVNAESERCRISQLWGTSGSTLTWTLDPEEDEASLARRRARAFGKPAQFPPSPSIETVLARVGPSVKDALQKYQQYAVPLFNRVARHRGFADVI